MSDNAQGYVPVTGPFAIVPDTAGLTDLSPSNDALRNAWFTGNVTAAGFVLSGGGSFLVNPMTTLGDVITGIAAGVPARLGIGAAGQVLTVVAGVPAWAPAPGSNPMTTLGDMIVGGAAGVESRLGIGATAQVLTVVAGVPAWAAPTPMTTAGDLIIGGVAGAATRLGVGTAGQVLTVSAGAPAWASLSQATNQILATPYNAKNNVVLTLVPDLIINLAAGVTYIFEIFLQVIQVSGTAGTAAAVGGTATFTRLAYTVTAMDIVNPDTVYSAPFTTFSATGLQVLTPKQTAWYKINGIITVNAGGTLGPTFAQVVADAANNTQTVQGSYITATPAAVA